MHAWASKCCTAGLRDEAVTAPGSCFIHPQTNRSKAEGQRKGVIPLSERVDGNVDGGSRIRGVGCSRIFNATAVCRDSTREVQEMGQRLLGSESSLGAHREQARLHRRGIGQNRKQSLASSAIRLGLQARFFEKKEGGSFRKVWRGNYEGPRYWRGWFSRSRWFRL